MFKGLSSFRAFHPVILVFPTRLPDGSPILTSKEDAAELHTEIDGRPVQIHFKLAHFDLKNLEELTLR